MDAFERNQSGLIFELGKNRGLGFKMQFVSAEGKRLISMHIAEYRRGYRLALRIRRLMDAEKKGNGNE